MVQPDDALERHLPALRRYAHLLSGASGIGDDLVERCLRKVPHAAGRIDAVAPLGGLLRIFHEANPVVPVSPPRRVRNRNGAEERTLRALAELSQRQRAVVLLRGTLRLAEDEIAEILRLTPEAVHAALIDARIRMAQSMAGHVLIIEDDFLLASEIASIVEAAGQDVCGPAATFEEAMRIAADCEPGLVLADIQLRDGKFAGIDAADAIAREHASSVVFITAYPERLARIGNLEPVSVLAKPFDYAALRHTITRSLAA